MKFGIDATRLPRDELINKYGLIGYALRRLLCAGWVTTDDEGDLIEGDKMASTMRTFGQLAPDYYGALITPDWYAAKAVLESLSNALAIYEMERVRYNEREYGGDLKFPCAKSAINESVLVASIADEIEEAIDILRRYVYNDDLPISEVPEEEELERAYKVASKIGYHGFWV